MKKLSLFYLVFICLSGCTDDELNVQVDVNKDLSFSGTFRTIDSDEHLNEQVTLKISNAHYECTTSLPFGYGAGKLVVTGNRINFIDTVFMIVPHLYGPSYVLSGEHYYKFNGEDLAIWRDKNVGSIAYSLTLTQ